MNLEGQWALVTGATRRVGRAIAAEFARARANVVIHCNTGSPDDVRQTAAAVEAFGVASRVVRADFADPAFPETAAQMAATLADEGIVIRVLVNNASVYERTPFAAATADQWDRIMAVNLRAPFLLAREFGLRMAASGGGAIINVTDALAFPPYKDYLPYLVSKQALTAMTRALAVELAPSVRVNSVAPGVVSPPADGNPKRTEGLMKRTLLRRFGEPDMVAREVVRLARDADFTTGAEFVVDGGASIG